MRVAVLSRQNRVMRMMICISLLMHVIILIHVADVYKKDSVSYIEFSLRADTAPKGRAIPRPRKRAAVPETQTVKKVFSDARVNTIDSRQIQNALSNTGDALAIPAVPGIDETDGLYSGGSPLFTTAEDYFEMVRLRIERHKTFPLQARKLHKEGGVTVRFVITGDGRVSSLQVTKKSGHSSLNRAALAAVREAAPFPAPPRTLFKDKLRVEIKIIFELM